MKLKYFGDSSDIVKKSLLLWLRPFGPWAAHPMFTHETSDAEAHAFSCFLGVPLVSTAVLLPSSDRQRYFESCRHCHSLFLDPDTGVRLTPCETRRKAEFIFAEEVVGLVSARPRALTLVFDQSLAHGQEGDQVRAKLSHFAKHDVQGFAYVSHASFMILGRSTDLVREAHRRILTDSALPLHRFVPSEAICESSNGYRRQTEAGVVRDLEGLRGLILIAKEVLGKAQTGAFERTLRYLAVSVADSSVAVAILCSGGYGADGVKIARGMFETHVTFRYLLRRPHDLRDFLDFDAVARYKRLQFYNSKLPKVYVRTPTEKINAVENAYRAVEKRFTDSNGKVRLRWSRHGLADMARVAGLADIYDLFYRYASSLHHVDPMGLAMLIDRETLEVQPGPTERHIGIALRMATMTLHDVLSEYSKLIGIDCSDALQRAGELIGGDVDSKGSALGSLADAFPPPSQ
jgi:hypothetical protein